MKIGLDFCNFSFSWFYEFFMCQINLFPEGNRKNICILMTCIQINYKTMFGGKFSGHYQFKTWFALLMEPNSKKKFSTDYF